MGVIVAFALTVGGSGSNLKVDNSYIYKRLGQLNVGKEVTKKIQLTLKLMARFGLDRRSQNLEAEVNLD